MGSSNGVAIPGALANEVGVMAEATWRRFSAEYKLKVLRESDACTKPREIGVPLHRGRLYSSNIQS